MKKLKMTERQRKWFVMYQQRPEKKKHSNNVRITADGKIRITADGKYRITQEA